MTEYKEKIGVSASKVEFLYDPVRGISAQISSSSPGFVELYMVAVSLDGRRLLSEVPATGIGVAPVYPKPSVITYIQSDGQGMFGRNCPFCRKYFRTNHVMGITCCPYCATQESGLAFVSKEQRSYIRTCYDAFARAYTQKKSTSVEANEITDQTPAWHYAEVKQQFHFTCDTKDCHAQTDILGEYGFCPRCWLTNGRKLFAERMDKMLRRWEETKKTFPESTPSDRKSRGEVWEDLTKESVSNFEALAKHLRTKLLRFPMTRQRRKEVEQLNFQAPEAANEKLTEWFDIGFFDWRGDKEKPPRRVSESELPFIKKMIQKRHILIHNGGIVDQD